MCPVLDVTAEGAPFEQGPPLACVEGEKSDPRLVLPATESRDGEQGRAASGKDVRPVVTDPPLLGVRARQLLRSPSFSRHPPQTAPGVSIEEDGAIRPPARSSHVGGVTESDRRPAIDGDLLQFVGGTVPEPKPSAVWGEEWGVDASGF